MSDNARGSLVLGTNSALLMGHLSPARLERSVSFKMDQVQAHVVCSEINPQQGPLWLQIANGKLSTPPGAESIMRQVLLPFKVRQGPCCAAVAGPCWRLACCACCAGDSELAGRVVASRQRLRGAASLASHGHSVVVAVGSMAHCGQQHIGVGVYVAPLQGA